MAVLRQDLDPGDLCVRTQVGKSCINPASARTGAGGPGGRYDGGRISFLRIQLHSEEGSSVWWKHPVLRRDRVAIQQIISSFVYMVPNITKSYDLWGPCFTSLTGKITNSGAKAPLLSGSWWWWHRGGLGLCGGVKSQADTTSNYRTPTNYYTRNLNDIICKISIILPTILDYWQHLMRWQFLANANRTIEQMLLIVPLLLQVKDLTFLWNSESIR